MLQTLTMETSQVTHFSPLTPSPCPYKEVRGQVSGHSTRLQGLTTYLGPSSWKRRKQQEVMQAAQRPPALTSSPTQQAGWSSSWASMMSQTRENLAEVAPRPMKQQRASWSSHSHTFRCSLSHLLLLRPLPLLTCLGVKVVILTVEWDQESSLY